jgi:hypothetical protein
MNQQRAFMQFEAKTLVETHQPFLVCIVLAVVRTEFVDFLHHQFHKLCADSLTAVWLVYQQGVEACIESAIPH